MKQNKKTILFYTMTAVFFAAVFVRIYFFSEAKILIENKMIVVEENNLIFENKIVSSTRRESQTTNKQTSFPLNGLIIPHFAPVSYLIEDALSHVTSTPDLIILIGPNHFEAGAFPISTGVYESPQFHHNTNFATEKIQQLLTLGAANKNDRVISGDHSMGTPLPIILSHFPQAKVVPIVLKYHQNPQNIEKLLRGLESISTSSTLIIASLDFSHYLSSDIAPRKDAETQKYIEAHDYKHIEGLSNDYIDSPWTLITFLRYLEVNGIQNGRELSHTNTGQVAGQTIESSTSFFTYIY